MTTRARLSLLFALVLIPQAAGARPRPQSPVDDAHASLQAALPEAKVTRSPLTGLVTFLSAEEGESLSPAALAGATAEERAIAFVASHAALFGLTDPGAELRLENARTDDLGFTHVRLEQLHQGVPITGAEMMVHLRGDRAVTVNARTFPVEAGLGTTPRLGPGEAVEIARASLRKHLAIEHAAISKPRLEVFNEGTLDGRRHPTRLAWFMEATRLDLRQYMWVDADSGALLLSFSQLPSALARAIHDSNSTAAIPGPLVRSEGGPATGDADADLAYNYSGDTYTYFMQQHGRDSYDGLGSIIRSTVDYCPPPPGSCPTANAFWTGTQMVYGAGFSRADDVNAHELAHGVTDTSARLFYYMQSGALNESFSDIFGESVDLVNGAGNDAAGVRWAMGEDVPGLGAIRNMMNPNLFNDPGKMTDAAQFVCQDPGGDRGGVHSNSGVPNHAYALMVDGGSYNGFTISGIGVVKAGKIQYRALTSYLLSGSDFLDNYNALQQSCTDLVGTAGITAADCVEVGKALDAVQMSQPWPCAPAQPAVPPLCPGSGTPQYVFNETFEGPLSWTTSAFTGRNLWFPDQRFATSGTQHIFGEDDGDATPDHSRMYMTSGVTIPAGARLQFNHSYGFENGGTVAYDGGRMVFSAGGGPFNTAGYLISGGANYNGTVASGFGNPLAGESAFVRDSWGYTATQLDLSSLAGQNVRFGFEIGTDISVGDYGWYIDDVRIYTCGAPSTLSIGDAAVVEGSSGAQCHPDPGAGRRPWFRLRNGDKHFYTIYPEERDAAVTSLGYVYEGVACHLPAP